jgi:hypothetical protein
MQMCTGGTGSTPCTYNACLNPLVNDREVKASFVTDTGSLAKIFVSYYPANNGANSNTLIACFIPKSQSGQKDPLTKWAVDGVTAGGDGSGSGAGDCISNGGTKSCYWCTK